MSSKYEKPFLVPLKADEDETALGDCLNGTGITGKCQAGATPQRQCFSGDAAQNVCNIGSGVA